MKNKLRKLSILFILLISIFAFSIPSFAADVVTLSTASDSISRGGELIFYVSVGGSSKVKGLAITLTYDSNVFEYVEYCQTGFDSYQGWCCKNLQLGSYTESENEGVAVLSTETQLSGTVFTFKLKAKNNAKLEASTVNVGLRVGLTGEWVYSQKSVTVSCTHSYGNWKTDKAASCTTVGSQSRTCRLCGNVQTGTIAALGHNYSSWTTSREATCTQTGIKQRTCTRCQNKETQTIAALGHNVVEGTITRESTCTVQGEMEGPCTRCGQTATAPVDLAPHNYGSWTDTKAATCTESGIREHSCINCGHTESEASLPLGHNYIGGTLVREATLWSTGLYEGICERCGASGSVVSPCSFKDTEFNLYFETLEGVFPENTSITISMQDITVEVPAENEEEEPTIVSKETIYSFIATDTLAEKTVEPSGSVTVTIPIPDAYTRNIAFYYQKESGKRTEIPIIINTEDRTFTAEISHFSDYVIENLDYEEVIIEEPEFEIPDWVHYTAEGTLFVLAILFIILFCVRSKKIKISQELESENDEQDILIADLEMAKIQAEANAANLLQENKELEQKINELEKPKEEKKVKYSFDTSTIGENHSVDEL